MNFGFLPPGTTAAWDAEATPATPIAAAYYDPATGRYVGPDGQVYTQSDLAGGPAEHKTWESLLVPDPAG